MCLFIYSSVSGHVFPVFFVSILVSLIMYSCNVFYFVLSCALVCFAMYSSESHHVCL